ncbi:hypothetical protein AB0M20_35060, partial [Actinoplanes sp. NPDC051633]|uniref:hypothetical protein n=1 Tax=Actinoplanes sp. NPDC051633 TaxID=3155670 RepID=UPI0034232449
MAFTQFLPGLREIRAHLTAGYLWLFTGWVLLPKIPKSVTGNALVERIRAAAQDLNPVALAVVVSVLAYLIGLTLSSISKVAMISIAPISVAIAVVALSHRALSWLVLAILAILLGLILQLAFDYGDPEKPFVVLLCGAVGLTCVAVLP